MKIHQNFLNYNCAYEQVEELARSLEQNQVSLKSNPQRSKGMINSAQPKKHCERCKSHRHETAVCDSKKCTLCEQWHHIVEECYLNPKSSKYKGAEVAALLWKKLGKTPPTPGPGNLVGAAFDTNKPPHVRIRATASSGEEISLVPDTGSSTNLISEHSCKAWGLELEDLRPGEGHLFDIQGNLLPVVGRAKMSFNLKTRNIKASVVLSVIKAPSLEHLIIGW